MSNVFDLVIRINSQCIVLDFILIAVKHSSMLACYTPFYNTNDCYAYSVANLVEVSHLYFNCI